MATLTKRGAGTPVTSGTPWATVTNAVDGTPPANPATYAVWSSTVANATAYIEVTGYDFSTIPTGSTINSVTISIRHLVSQATRVPTITWQVYDGATTIGAANACTSTTSAHNDAATRAPTLAQLKSATFKVRANATRFNGTQAGTWSVDHIDVTVDYTLPAPSITQAAYQFFDDAGTESGAAALAAQNTLVVGNLANGDGYGVLRLRLQSTTAVAVDSTNDFQLQWEKNANGTWTNVATTGTTVLAYDNPNLTATGPTTSRLTGGTGTFVTGEVCEDGVVNDLGWAGNNYTEILYALKLLAANLANGDVLRFRVILNGATTNMTYSVTPTINIVVPVALVVADTANASTSDSLALTQTHLLAGVGDSAHLHETESVVLEAITAVTLVVADTVNAHTTDVPALTQIHLLALVDTSNTHTADSPALTQTHLLVLLDTANAHSSDGAALAQTHLLAPVDTLNTHSSDSVVVTQVPMLVISDTVNAHTTDAAGVLAQTHVLAPVDTAHAHTTDPTALVQTHTLVVADTLNRSTSDVVALAQTHALAVADTLNRNTSDVVALAQRHLLVVVDTVNTHISDSPVVSQDPSLVVADTFHGHTTDPVALAQTHALTIVDTVNRHRSDAVVLSVGAPPVGLPLYTLVGGVLTETTLQTKVAGELVEASIN